MRLPLRVLLFLAATPLMATPFQALQDGEYFRYRVSWGIFSNAGEVIIDAKREHDGGRDLFRVKTLITSRGVIRGVYSFDDRGEMVVDAATSRILSAKDEGMAGSKRLESNTTFDYERRIATHTDVERPGRNRQFAIPEGDPVDLISALIQTRDWNLQVGDKREAVVYFGRDVYPITLYATGREDAETPMGEFKTTLLVPRMEKEEPRGVFKRGGEIKVWVSDGPKRLPVKMQLKLNFGTALLSLVEHRPGTTPPAPAAPAAP